MGLFHAYGVHAVVDGQYGSTGKGALVAWLAQQAIKRSLTFTYAITNGGPNSGHTFYDNGIKHVLKQLPTFSVAMNLLGGRCPAYLSAGAVIDPAILRAEALKYPGVEIWVHPNAAVISDAEKAAEQQGSVAAVAGTRSGTGAALARKVLREPDAVWGVAGEIRFKMPQNVGTAVPLIKHWDERIFLEVSQGFSLGINDARFYPKTTSRECTVMQGISDARLPPRSVMKTYMCIRTYPIRVGDVDGFSSGDWYPDQYETSWEELGETPELTTVTQRVRRVAFFSQQQFEDALRANAPDFVFINFLNYLKGGALPMLDYLQATSENLHGVPRFDIIEGYGPERKDIVYVGA